MPAVEEALGRLADAPPVAPTPPSEIRARARARVRRRRAGLAAVALVAALGTGVGVGLALDGDLAEDVSVVAGPTPTPAPDGPDATGGSDGPTRVVVNPDREGASVTDGEVVGVSLDVAAPEGAPVTVAQCGGAAVAEPSPAGVDDVLAWCGRSVVVDRVALVPGTVLPHRVARLVTTANGAVDCGAAVAACVMVVVLPGPGPVQVLSGPLRFAPVSEPGSGPVATVAGPVDQVRDGARLLVTLTDVATDDVVTLAQCDADDVTRCSDARSRTITVQHGPETQVTFVAFHDVAWAEQAGAEPEWTTCHPCALVVRIEGRAEPVAVQPMTMRATADPLRPTIEVDAGAGRQVAPGDSVQVRVTGLQPSAAVAVRPCVATPTGCTLAGMPTEVIADDDGVALVADLVVPATVAGVACTGDGHPAGAGCGIAVDLGAATTTALTFAALPSG